MLRLLLDHLTIAANNCGGIARALSKLWQREKTADWQNRTYWLTREG